MTSFLKQGALAAALTCAQLGATAADLDLYSTAPGANPADLPNVLFVIDNTANWTSAFSNEMAALKNTLRDMPANKFNVGIMLGTESGSGNLGPQGGYVRAAIRPMNEVNKLKYMALVQSLDRLYDKGNGGTSSLQLAEAWAYFSGGKPYSGNQKIKTDFAGNTAGTSFDDAVHALPGNALLSRSGTQYAAPPGTQGCAGGQNYIIYISNGPNQNSTSVMAMSNQLLAAAGGAAATAQIALSPGYYETNPADEWTRFMRQSPLGIVTYSIEVNPYPTGPGPGWTALLKSMSGLSNYRAVTSNSGGVEIQVAINNALAKIQSVNSVFAPVSLARSANISDAYLNQVYVASFRPDAGAKPRWMGNLKQYQAGPDGTLVDADGASAISSQTGFFAECARSHWTPPLSAPDNYWMLDPKGACIAPGGDPLLYAASNTPDGSIVEKGGQAFVQRNHHPGTRKVLTCATASCTALADMTTATVSAAALGAADTTEQAALINWARGANIDGELGKPANVMRPSAHGDVIHSKPLALSDGPDVVVYYGSNDGMLRAVNGNRTHSIGGMAAGSELWTFMPPEFFGNLKRLRANTDTLGMAQPFGQPSTGAAKPYGFDGPVTAWQSIYGAGSYPGTSWLFAAMGRGGRAVYAFDVTDKMAPALKWKAGCASADDYSCTPGTSGFGQTWSAPVVVRAEGYRNGEAPLLIMGGGYDHCEDADQASCTGASKGRNITVLDADSGAVLKVFDTERGVVGDVSIVLGAYGGLGNFAYAADLGGNLYRIDMRALAPQDWRMTKVASLGCTSAAASCHANRKFMHAPSAVAESDGSVSVYLGSGDREKPLGQFYNPSTAAVANYFFKLIDKPDDAAWLASEWSNCGGRSVICLDSLSSAGDTDDNTLAACGAAPAADKKGWYLGLRPSEQVVTLAATRFGATTFSTHMPAVYQPGACGSNLGTAHVYNLSVDTAAPVGGSCSVVVPGGGLSPSPQKLDVCMDAGCTIKRPVCIGCGSNSPLQMQPDATP